MSKSNPINSLLSFLNTIGKITRSKKDNAKGVIVYNPSHFQLSELEHLAEECGFGVIHKDSPSQWEGRTVPPSVFVGVINNALTEDEATAFLSSLQ